jgi:hypothetical protein
VNWQAIAERLLSKLPKWAAVDVEYKAWAKGQSDAALELASDRAAQVLPLVEGTAAEAFKQIVAGTETGMIEDLLVALGQRRVDDARDLARMVDGQRRAVSLLEQAVRRGAAASLELAARRKT